MKKVAILQSDYIPWKGYFDIINMVDEFILYDDMQYTKRDWRNRNKIVTPNGLLWLSIPVENKGKFHQKINETRVVDNRWAFNHWRSIQYNYSKTRFFSNFSDRINKVYEECKNEVYLSLINYRFIREICDILGINTKITWSSDYNLIGGKTERLVGLVQDAGGDCYLSGPAAKGYIVESLFFDAGINLEWMDYSGYPPYTQSSNVFEHGVSVLDLIFNEGCNARNYMKSFNRKDDVL